MDPPSLPDAVRLRREAAEAEKQVDRLREAADRAEERANGAIQSLQDTRRAATASAKEAARLGREVTALRERCRRAEDEADKAKSEARRWRAKVGVGRRDAAVVEHIRRLKSELAASRKACDGLRDERDALRGQLAEASKELGGLVAALELRADELIQGSDGEDSDAAGAAPGDSDRKSRLDRGGRGGRSRAQHRQGAASAGEDSSAAAGPAHRTRGVSRFPGSEQREPRWGAHRPRPVGAIVVGRPR